MASNQRIIFLSVSLDFHLKVVQNCTPTSNLNCSCEVGYSCSDFVPYPKNCRYCTKIQKTTGNCVLFIDPVFYLCMH